MEIFDVENVDDIFHKDLRVEASFLQIVKNCVPF